MSLNIKEIEAVLKDKKLPDATLKAVVEELKAVEEEKKNEKDTEPKSKNQYVIIALDKTGQIKDDLTGFVVQIPESDNPAAVLDKVKESARQYALTRKARKYPVKTVADVAKFVKRAITKNAHIHFKHKDPVLIVRSDNNI